MKKLYLIRHAKSSWEDLTLHDFDRPLSKRGKNDIPKMAMRLKESGVVPDIILSSGALRAKLTVHCLVDLIGYNKPVKFDNEIYESNSTSLYKIITSIDDKYRIAFIVGHNPSLNMLAEDFVGLSHNIPTCGIVEIDFSCSSWSDISSNNARLISFDYPKKKH